MGVDLRVYLFTKRHRFILAVIFTTLCVIQLCLGVVTTGWSIYICLVISPRVYSEKTEINFVFTVTGIFGTHIIIHYLVGIKMCEKCVYKAHKKSTKRLLLFWSLSGCNTILNIIILAFISIRISKHIANSMRHSIEKGMQNYLSAPAWKRIIDKWQYSLQCCGVNDYKDWYDLTWLDRYHIDISSPFVEEMRLSRDRFHFPVIPWSCCRIDFPMQCLHDPFQQIQSAYLWKEQPKLVLESIYTEGCLEKLRAPIGWSLTLYGIVCMTLVIIHAIIIVIARLLYTSCKNAVILRDPDGESPGYLLTRGCCGQAHRTVSELVLDLKLRQTQAAKPNKPSSIKKKLSSTKKHVSKLGSKRKEAKTQTSPSKSKRRTPTFPGRRRRDDHYSSENPVSSEEEAALMLR